MKEIFIYLTAFIATVVTTLIISFISEVYEDDYKQTKNNEK